MDFSLIISLVRILVSLLVLLSVSASEKPQDKELEKRSTDVARVERRLVMGRAHAQVNLAFLFCMIVLIVTSFSTNYGYMSLHIGVSSKKLRA